MMNQKKNNTDKKLNHIIQKRKKKEVPATKFLSNTEKSEIYICIYKQ